MDGASPITSRRDFLSIIAIIFAVTLGLYLRWWNLGGPSLWFDEGYTAWLASNSYSEIVRLVRADTAPPLYYLLLHGWMRIFGSSELALRSFSCTCATLSLAIVYALCRREKFSLRQTAIVLSVLSMSVLQVRYARDARCYALVSLFAAIQLYGLFAYRESRKIRHALVIILASAAMLYTHNMTAVYIAAMLGGWMLFADGSWRRRFVETGVAGAGIAMLFAPWISQTIRQAGEVTSKFWIPRPGLRELGRSLQVIVGLREDFAGNAAAPVSRWVELAALLLVIAFLIFTLVACRPKNGMLRIAVAYAVGPVVVVFMYSLFRTPLLIDRVFIPSSIAIALFAGMAIAQVQIPYLRAVIPAMMVLAGISSVGYVGYEQKEDWRSAIEYVDAIRMRHPRTLVFLANEGELLHRYYARNAEHVTGLPSRFLEDSTPRAMQRVERSDDLANLYKVIEDPRNAEIDLIVSHGSRDKDKQAMKLLSETCRLIDTREFPNIRVYRYAIDTDLIVRGE
jgi:uncharacterized membrane protein